MSCELNDIGYVALFLYSFGGGFIGLATAAVFASLGKMNLIASILLAGSANFIGSTFLFYFARNSKTEVMSYLKQHRRKLALVHLLMKKYSYWILYVQKFIYGIKTLVPLVAGITKYDAAKFILINLIASFIWALLVAMTAYIFGSVIMQGIAIVESKPWIAPLIIVLVGSSIYFYLSKMSVKNLNKSQGKK